MINSPGAVFHFRGELEAPHGLPDSSSSQIHSRSVDVSPCLGVFQVLSPGSGPDGQNRASCLETGGGCRTEDPIPKHSKSLAPSQEGSACGRCA